MAHELDRTTGVHAIALRGGAASAWHGYGQAITDDDTIDTIRVKAGLSFNLTERPIYVDHDGDVATGNNPQGSLSDVARIPDYKAISRDDTLGVLSIVARPYKIVQPAEVLEFFRDLTEQHGYQLETAGALRGGRRYWALAKTGRVAKVLGEDELRDYLLLSSSCDGTLATTGQFTSIRVVCNNTLSYAVNDAGHGRRVSITHATAFKADAMKEKLAASEEHWTRFVARTEAMATKAITLDQAVRYFAKVYGVGAEVSKAEQRKLDRLMHELEAGLGSSMASARRTVWGLVNAVTHDVDHGGSERAEGNRQDRAWFGVGAVTKAAAVQAADDLMVAA